MQKRIPWNKNTKPKYKHINITIKEELFKKIEQARVTKTGTIDRSPFCNDLMADGFKYREEKTE